MRFLACLLTILLVAGCDHKTPESASDVVQDHGAAEQGPSESAAEEIASQVPDTDIFVVRFDAQGNPDTTSLKNLTDRPGYDNQPAFLPGGNQLLFSSIRETLQSDVYVMDRNGGEARRLSDTLESEYSPTPLSGGGFSVVRVEEDGTQRLWAYNADGSPARMLVSDLDNVGYHLWLSDEELALFLVDEPMKFVLGNVATPGVRLLATDIGRSFARDAETGILYFLLPSGDGRWRLNGHDLSSGEKIVYLDAPGESQDMALDHKGRLWMASGTALWRWQPGQSQWEEVADFGSVLGGTITRLGFDDDDSSLAMVVSMASQDME